MEPPNNGQIGDEHFVHCLEVVPSSEVEMYGQYIGRGQTGCYGYCKQLEIDVGTTTPSVINTTGPVATSATMPKIVIQDTTKPFTLTNTHPVVTTTNIQASNKPIKLTTTCQAIETATSTIPVKLIFIRPIETATTKNLIQEPTKSVKLTLTRPVETSGTTTKKPIKPTTTPPVETTKNLIEEPTKPVDPNKQPIPQGIIIPFVCDGKTFVIVTKPQ